MKSTYYTAYSRVEKDHWWFRVRRLMIHNILREYIHSSQPLNILDVGCGTGVLLEELEQYGRASGVDFSKEAVQYSRARGLARVEEGRVEALPFANGEFDVVMALDVIEHIADDNLALKELYRVLKSGGLLIIFVPAFKFLWGITDIVSHHFRRYTERELKAKIVKSGFIPIRMSYFNTFLFLPILVVRTFSRLLPTKYQPEHELNIPSKFFNQLFYLIFKFEAYLLNYLNFPFGVSLGVVVTKS